MAAFTTSITELFSGVTELLTADGTKEVNFASEGVLGIYFSAHWCPPCRAFTPQLAAIYNELKAAGKNFEVVFVSSDRDEEAFDEYRKEMPWLALPFDSGECKDLLDEKFSVTGLPTLVLLDAASGAVITEEGRGMISEAGAAGFPFTPEALLVAKTEALALKSTTLASLDLPALLGGTATRLGDDAAAPGVDLAARLAACEAFAIAFTGGGRGSAAVLPKLAAAQRALGGRLETVVVDLGGTPVALLEQCAGVCVCAAGTEAAAVTAVMSAVVGDIEEPHVVVVTAAGAEGLALLCEDAARDVYVSGTEGFPWTEARKAELAAEAEAFKAGVKAKQDGLEFLFTPERAELPLSGGQEGGGLTRAELTAEGAVTGLYFSAHWCGPCRMFTPMLTKTFKECKAEGKRFHVVFMSSDNDEAGFDEYFAEMPWACVPFAERELKAALSEIFEVRGIPSLVLLDAEGKIITTEGRAALDYGPGAFPFADADVERCKAARTAEALVAEAKWEADQDGAAAGALVRVRGEPMSCDAVLSAPCSDGFALPEVQFNAFVTFGAPALAASAGKLYYEVEYLEIPGGGGISQVGWATPEYEQHENKTGDGVGDGVESYGFDPQRVVRFHGGKCEDWGKKAGKGSVLGVAADLDSGAISFSVDGEFAAPLGVAYEGDSVKGRMLYPALTGGGVKVRVNLGKGAFKHAPPDAEYVSPIAALARMDVASG